MKLFCVTMFSVKLLVVYWILDDIIATQPLNSILIMPNTHEFFPLIRSGVSKIRTPVMTECRENVYTLCGLRCAQTRFCAAINYKDGAEGNENNCQLTNTTKQKFDENASTKEKVWTFRKVHVDRNLVPECNGEINECHNGGTMIWDPVKTFSCICKEGYRGELCNIDIDECSEESHTCAANANCTKTNGSFRCDCKIGFSGNGKSCTDIDECFEGSHTCGANANCTKLC